MNLHRTTGTADWANVKPERRNFFQKVAAATYGIITPANLLTSAGLALVIAGLVTIMRGELWPGLALLATGRLLDVADGAVAEATKTKSPLGEVFDATVDKLGTVLTIAALIVANVTYWWVIVALVLPQVIIPLVIFYKKTRGIGVHPTRQGKLSMLFTWVGIVGLIAAKALNDSRPLGVVVTVVVLASLLLGLYAAGQYATERDSR